MRLQATANGLEPIIDHTTVQPARRSWLKRLGALLGGSFLVGRAQASPKSVQAADPYIGEIMMFAGNFAPAGWAFCNGQILSIAQNTALFSIIGTTYGGNGQTTFALPNLQSRIPIHWGQGPGLSTYVWGQTGGSENVTLLTTQMPTHTHSIQVTTASGNVSVPSASAILSSDGQGVGMPYSTSGVNTTLSPQSIGTSGGNQPHPNLQPYLAVSFCISLQGIYPTRA